MMSDKYHIVSLAYLHSKINFFIERSLSLDHVFDFFSTHFLINRGRHEEDRLVDVYITPHKEEVQAIDFHNGEDIYIRKSATEYFTIPCKRVTVEGIEYVKCTKTDTILSFDRENKKIIISTQLQNAEQDELVFIEFIRDLVLKNEENHGVAVVHATSALKDDKATLIIGSKGKGKSTLLLELVSKHGYKLISGDKTFLWIEDGKLRAAGWPDYPHLGLGTLSKYPEFVEYFGLSHQIESVKENLWSTEHKMAIDPVFFKKVIPFAERGESFLVESMIYPDLFPSTDCEIKRVSNHEELIVPHIEKIFTEGNTMWNHFIRPVHQNELERKINQCLELAGKLSAFEVSGSGVLEGSGFSERYAL
ncbi:hypothetical protein [Bacillus tequilensis]|uniref:hypothetical protein n=1 Tax=Bacillus tequilensis TaxID=227866 RepID=UPI0004645997|nr:hypothetical protein [Bacillus tequilensis]MDR4432792.1 hypothetical protein [Bacillus tequilensis]SPT93603.1 Uncharacterised protein [Bacillus tequilensis]